MTTPIVSHSHSTTTTTTTTTTPSRGVRPSSSTTPKRDSPCPNSHSRKSTTNSISTSTCIPKSKPNNNNNNNILPLPHKPTTTTRSRSRRSLLLLSKPKPKPPRDLPPPLPRIPPNNRPPPPSLPVDQKYATPSPSRPPRRLITPPPVDSFTHHQQDLIASLQSQVLTLTTELQKAQSFNLHLQSQNSNLSLQLSAAHSMISSLTTLHQKSKSAAEIQTPKFQDIQRSIFNKLEQPAVSCKEEKIETLFTNSPPAAVSVAGFTTDASKIIPELSSAAPSPPPPPPPPPPLPGRPAARAVTTQKASAVVELYQSLATKRGNGYPPVLENSKKTSSAHNSIVGEIQNRSAHLLAIKMDIETKGEFINGLIQKVLAAVYTDIEDVLSFVDWLDKELSLLADEQAVLKHFKWPEKKADAMREAAIEYRNLKLLENEVSSYKDDFDVPCGVALKKMACLLDKSERSLQRLIQLRNSGMLSYRAFKIPTDWMLDSGIVSKIKQASINLAKTYVKRVTIQLESFRYSERESTQEALLFQGVHFAYRAHQFCGGLDSETLCAVEEIRRRVPGHLKGSPQLFAGIPSS